MLTLCVVLVSLHCCDGVLERILKPAASVLLQPSCDGAAPGPWLVETVAHVTTWRPLTTVAEGRLALDASTLPRPLQCLDEAGQVARCHCHSAASLRLLYDLDADAAERLEAGALYVLRDPPRLLPEACRAALPGPAPVHAAVGQRARRYRRGEHVYAGCNELCPPHLCLHQHEIQLDWVLAPLWEGRPSGERWQVSFINIGCKDFAWPDPLEALLGSGALLSGLCIDGNGTALEEARRALEGHDVRFVEAWLRPEATGGLLREHWPARDVDVLKVDIDSYDVDVLHACLVEVRPSAVIVEFEYSVPPPFSWARHVASAPWRGGSLYPASLSYFVEMLGGLSFRLYKMNHNDAVFVHDGVAGRFAAAHAGLAFPVDEWACWLRQAFSNDEHDRIPRSYIREWTAGPDLFEVQELVWGNLSQVSRPPFSFDLLTPRAQALHRSGFRASASA